MHELIEVAASQGNVVAVRQARALGVRPEQLDRRVVREGWTRPLPDVVALPGAEPGRLLELRAVAARVGSPVAATRWTAAQLHGLRPRLTLPFQLVVAYRRRGPRLTNVQILRSRTFAVDRDVVTVHGVAVVRVERLLLDLAASTDAIVLRGLVIDAVQRRLTTLPSIAGYLAAVSGRGVPGRARIVTVVEELTSSPVDSVFEDEVARTLRDLGYAVRTQVQVVAHGRTLTVDLAVGDDDVLIECDGFAAHATRAQLDVDARRANRLALAKADLLVLRLTHDRWHRDRAGFLAELDDALAQRRARRCL